MDKVAGEPRLNLICNGMMLFHEVDADYLEIVIPMIKDHVRGFCKAAMPTRDDIDELAVGEFALSGPPANSGAKLADLFDAFGCVALKKGPVSFDRLEAAKVSAIIKVPKPNVVRLYRGSEPVYAVDKILGNCVDQVWANPRILHDIAVLSYTKLDIGKEVVLKDGAGVKMASGFPGKKPIQNWMLVSNDSAKMQASHDTAAINNLLRIDKEATTLNLSTEGAKDDPADTAIGVSSYQLRLYHELPAGSKDFANIRSSKVICTHVVLS